MREIWKESMKFVEQSTTKFELGRSFQDAEGLMKPYWYGLRHACRGRKTDGGLSAQLRSSRQKGVGDPKVNFTFVSLPLC